MQVATVDPENIEQAREVADRAAAILDRGGLVVFPTETVYGVGAAVGSDQAIEALRSLKGADRRHAFAVHLPDAAWASRYVDTDSPSLRRLIRKVFPGPVTLVVEADAATRRRKLSELGLPESSGDRMYHDGVIALRCPDHPLTQAMLAGADGPIVAGGANRRGEPPPHDAREAIEAVGDRAALVIDAGRTRYAKPSTVLRVRGGGATRSVTVEREGVYDQRFVRKLMRWTVLMVCSGNTCRSPMAEAMAARLLADQRGLAVADLEAAGVRVLSAGVFAMPGQPAAAEAVEAMRRMGVDLSSHRSRTLTPELIHEADVIYAMTQAHRQAVLDMAPAAKDKVFLLSDEGDIEDPIGSDMDAYQHSARRIRRHLEARLKEQQP